MLVTSIFSFSHNNFYLSQIKLQFLIHMYLKSANAFNLDQSKILSFSKELTLIQKELSTNLSRLCKVDLRIKFVELGTPIYHLTPNNEYFTSLFLHHTIPINSLPNDKILDQSKLKAFADNKLKVIHTAKFALDKIDKRAIMALGRSSESFSPKMNSTSLFLWFQLVTLRVGPVLIPRDII